MKKTQVRSVRSSYLLAIMAIALFASGMFVLWMASLRIPAMESLLERRMDGSTKIYDRTGEILLYDFSPDVKRDVVPLDKVSTYAKNATIAIEDKNFYSHHGFELSSFVRAVLVNLTTMSFSQGGSTITQQVVKNSILTKDKTPTRKLKELILALKLEKVLTKEDILSLYLNEIPYGGTHYGIEEAAQSFLGKSALDLTLAESTYLAALPKAPSYYSPYGSHRQELENRKNLILREMLSQGVITQDEYDTALEEKVDFKGRNDNTTIKAPHFVFFVIDELMKKYGEDAVRSSGWKVVTTLDYSMQRDAEDTSAKYGSINEKTFDARNNAIVAIDPKTGEILVMVGSRDYFDQTIDGNFNAALGLRQPGSTFKPFVYSVLFNKGYTDKTILFDAPIQFSSYCEPDNFTTDDKCYSPGNYDEKFRGPMTIRDALAQSINVPAVEAIYLAGVSDSIKLARDLGIQGLTEPDTYGLSLVLGGGSVTLLDMVSAYSVFANDGVRNPYTPILWVEDYRGNIIDKHSIFPRRVLPVETTRTITSILSDNIARTPSYGVNSPLYMSDNVAVKTGTSNDYRDAWIIGYSPGLVVGAWTGNSDNSPMAKKVAGLIVSPLWRELMDKVLSGFPEESFIPPEPEDPTNLKPILRGEISGEQHSILYYVDRDNPRGSYPPNHEKDAGFNNWEYGVRRWYTKDTETATIPQVSPTIPPTDLAPLPTGF
ncbi:MAG: hypothetical protein EXS69_01355 [Candidatus Zambryskibacteria bacterium]|nr:hypothetical protein [Candidatus Zambryskibacteria bacterium]